MSQIIKGSVRLGVDVYEKRVGTIIGSIHRAETV